MNVGTTYKNWQVHMLNAQSCGKSSEGHGGEYKYDREFPKEDADVCLRCTKAKCRGTNKCFEKMKRTQKEK